jgi:hypothetical protein
MTEFWRHFSLPRSFTLLALALVIGFALIATSISMTAASTEGTMILTISVLGGGGSISSTVPYSVSDTVR